MNPVIRLLCAFVLLAATELRADLPPLPAEPREVAPAAPSTDTRLPGVALAEGITQLTGVAISPLLGVSGVGAWEYFTTEASRRPELPWFCHPVAWGIGFGILALVLIKDLSGAAMPAMLKKPLDVIELFENKLSAIVASAALVPFLDRQIAEVFAREEGPVAAAGFAASGLATIEPALAQSPTLLLALLVPLSLIAFFAVWLSSHALNVLILRIPRSLSEGGPGPLCRLPRPALGGRSGPGRDPLRHPHPRGALVRAARLPGLPLRVGDVDRPDPLARAEIRTSRNHPRLPRPPHGFDRGPFPRSPRTVRGG
jgi:hypothetical protein